MDKETLSNYGWVVVVLIVLALMISLATPFGSTLSKNIKESTTKLMGVASDSLNNVTKYESFDDLGSGDSGGGESGGGSNPESGPVMGENETQNVIPEGASYTQGLTTFVEGDEFPETVQDGDLYVYGDYEYCYNRSWLFDMYEWVDPQLLVESEEGWGVRVLNQEQTEYGEILDSINGKPVTFMYGTFAECYDMTTAPELPDSVVDLGWTFYNCASLLDAPAIPSNVINMDSTFWGCSSMIDVVNVIIPASVENMYSAFGDCTSIGGPLTIHANPADYDGCFENVDFLAQDLRLGGTSTVLDDLGATGINYEESKLQYGE